METDVFLCQTHNIVYIKYVQFVVYQLYLDKTVNQSVIRSVPINIFKRKEKTRKPMVVRKAGIKKNTEKFRGKYSSCVIV